MRRLFPAIAFFTLFLSGCHDNDVGNQSRATVTTAAIANITASTATGGGEVTSDGHLPVSERGIVWGTSPHPTDAGLKIPSGSGAGIFTSELTNLKASTTYYVRAYAVNYLGTSYGEEVSFTTNK